MEVAQKRKWMSNRVTNNIQIQGNEGSRTFFDKLCRRFSQRPEDKLSQIPAVLWKNSHDGTISWSYKHMKCRWAVVEKTGMDYIIVLSGKMPASGMQERIFKTIKKIDPKVVIINEYEDTEHKYIGTRILYCDYDIEEKVSEEEIKNIDTDGDVCYNTILEMKKAARYRAEGRLSELTVIEEGDYNDD
jgi:hypothetical protein